MDVHEAIMSRHSCRRFKPDPVPEEQTTLDALADQQQEGGGAPAEETGDE